MAQERDVRELQGKLLGLEVKHRRASEELTQFCRAVLPVLQDHKLDNLAHELGAKLFAVDMVKGELVELVKADPELSLMAILKGLEGAQ